MKSIIRLSLLVILLYLTAKISVAQNQSKKATEKLMLAKIRALPEVKDFFSETPKAYKPALMIEGESDSTSKYYWVKVGISNFNQFRTVYGFF